MKKILSLILALLMTASCAATIFADDTAIADGATEETTATEATPYDLALEFLDAKKIMQGWDGELHPEKAVRRFEMALFVTRISTGLVDNEVWEDGPINGTEFTDLEGSAAADYLGALSYANQHGIINGYEDGTFKPENTVTYRDALVMACRTLGYTGLEYKWGYIEKAVTLGLTKDITGVAYTDEITRGVAAQIIFNALEAKTADGKKLAQESFDFDYDWKKIVVVHDGVRNYVPEAALTAPSVANHVAFKFIEEDGTLSDEVLYVDNVTAGLKFGEFYKAYIGKVGGEYVDLFKTEQIVPGALITNDGNDDADGVHDDVTAFLTGKVLTDKYTVRDGNFSLTSSLVTNKGKEIMVVEPGSAPVEVGTYVPGEAGSGTYAIDWATGDILEKGDDGKYKVIWHYNEKFGIYFRYKDTNATINNVLGVAGIEVMDDEDLAELKVKIEEAMIKYVSKLGYTVKLAAPTAGYQYSSLLPYDLNGDGAYDYAKYEQYKYGSYSTGNCGHTTTYTLGNVTYYAAKVAGCEHCTDAAYAGFSFVEGYKPTTTGEVIYGVNMVTKELKIIKEVLAKGSNTDADTYYAYGVVRGFDMASKSVIIDGTPYTWGADPAKLNGVTADPGTNEYFYDSLFNQYVKFVVVDGKLNSIAAQGVNTDYIIVERYLGIDNEGLIVIQGYSVYNGRTLTTFRIKSFDGWKVGDAFFYGDNHDLEYYFAKGNIYAINSVDASESPVAYNVTPIGVAELDRDQSGNVVIGSIATTATVVEFTFEDNYILKDGKYSGKMAATDTYVIIGETDPKFNFKPIYIYTGIVPTDAPVEWKVKGNLINTTSPYIFVNVKAGDIVGFDYDVATGFVATLANRGVQSAYYDEYTANYYFYGATKYSINAFDLINGTSDKVAVEAYNFKPEKYSVYITIDGKIVDDTALTYKGFQDAMTAAYGDGKLDEYKEDIDASKYIPFSYKFTKAEDVTAATLSTWMSTKTADKGSYYFKLKNPHNDLLDGIITHTVILDAKDNITDIKAGIVGLDWTKYDYTAFCFYDKSINKVRVYFADAADYRSEKPAPAPVEVAVDLDIPAVHKIEVAKDVYVTATANVSGKQLVGKWTEAKVDTITFAWDGDALKLMNHNTIDKNDYHFGDTGYCKTENWNLKLGLTDTFTAGDAITLDKELFDKVEVATFDGAHEECVVDCDCIKSVTIALDKALEVGKEVFAQVYFTSYEDVDGAAGNKTNYRFTVRALLKADGTVYFDYYAGTYDTDKSYIGFDGDKYTVVTADHLVKAQ